MQPDNQLLESALEKRFVEALRREHDGSKFKLSEVLFKGKAGYELQAGARRWRVELQVPLGEADGVVVPCRPDFVFWPDDTVDDLPIALFVDGWQYHKDIVTTDLVKRMAVAKSGRFSVWTLTWDDVEAALLGQATKTPSPWPNLIEAQSQQVVEKLCSGMGLPGFSGFAVLEPFTQLHRRLAGVTGAQMRQYSVALAVGLLMPPGDQNLLQAMKERAFLLRLDELALPPNHADLRQSFRALGDGVSMMLAMRADQLRHVMSGKCSADDEPWLALEWLQENMGGDEIKLRWQQLWRLLNLLLPLRHLWAGCADMPGLAMLLNSPLLQQSDVTADWLEALEIVATELSSWCQALATMGVNALIAGFELLDDKQCVLAEAELAWPALKVAIFLPDYSDTLGVFESQGWHCFVAEGGALPEPLRNLLMETLA